MSACQDNSLHQLAFVYATAHQPFYSKLAEPGPYLSESLLIICNDLAFQCAKDALVDESATRLGQDSERKLNQQLMAYKPTDLIFTKSTERMVRDKEH